MLTLLFDGIAYGMLLFVLAVGLAVTLGLMNFINLAHGAFAMAGGYITVLLMNRLGVPFLVCLPLAFLGAAAIGALLEPLLYRRMYAKPHLDQVLFSIGLVFIAVTIVLETRGLVKRFGGIVPTNDVSIQLERGARRALIGPNGAGKTTLINLLTGVLEPSSGSIWLDGQDITQLAPHQRVRRGVVRTFQINQLFNELTPLQSLALAVSAQLGVGAQAWKPLGADARVAPICDTLLAQFRLDDVMHQPVKHLAYGKRRLLEIATALACAPRVLLLDEPVAGVPEGERQEIFDIVNALPPDVSVLLIEHDMDLVFNFASSVTVLVNGAVFAEGSVDAIANDPRVKAVYLGEGDALESGAHG